MAEPGTGEQVKQYSNSDWPIKPARLENLPLFALAAFAGRCARRVQPVLSVAWEDAPAEKVEAVEKAISLAEIAGAKHHDLPDDINLLVDSVLAEGDAHAALMAGVRDRNTREEVILSALAFAPLSSARLAADVVRAAREGHREKAAKLTTSCAEVAGALHGKTRDVVITAMLDDVEVLKEEAARGNLTEETPVPPALFGDLWRRGKPEAWPGVPGISDRH